MNESEGGAPGRAGKHRQGEHGQESNANPIGGTFAEIDCRLSANTVRRPELSVFLGGSSRRFDINQIPVPLAPDIAVEVFSPSESAVDVNRKALEYLAAGCEEVWLVDIANGEIFVQTEKGIRLLRGNDTLDSPMLPGFSATVSDILGRAV